MTLEDIADRMQDYLDNYDIDVQVLVQDGCLIWAPEDGLDPRTVMWECNKALAYALGEE